MKVIDAFTGRTVKVGDVLPHPDDFTYQVVKITPGVFNASINVIARGKAMTWPLQVRWTHPKFFLEHVAFIPT